MQKKNLINLRIAVFIATSLILGIITAYFFKLQNNVLGIITTVIFLAFITAFFLLFFEKDRIKTNSIFVLVFALFFVLGISSFSIQTENYQNADLNGHYFAVQGKVTKVENTDTGSALVVSDVSVKGVVDGKLKYKIMLYVYGENTLDIGDYIRFNAMLKDKSLVYENSFSPYDIGNKIKYTASTTASEIKVVAKNLNVFEICNLFIRDTLKSGLDYNEFSVAYGMLTGDSELMDYNVITAYRYLGVAHIFAVSGLHIGFLATALNFILNKLKTKRLLKAFIITAILFFYSGVCGFTASSIRATIMSAVLLFLSAKGERYDGLSAVSIAGVIILILSPVQLFCVGFQLSFVVVIGILLLAKPIERFLIKKVKFVPKKICSSIGVVVSAQLASIPISLASFGYFSPISVVANFILIPVICIIFYFLFLLTVIGGIFSIPNIALFLPNYVLKFINVILTTIDSEKLLISGITFGAFSLLYYIAMLIPSGIFNLKLKTKIISTMIAVFIFLTGTTVINTTGNEYVNVYVCGSETASVTVVEADDENVLIVSDTKKIFSVGNLRRLSYKNGILNIDTVIFGGGFDYDMQVFISRLNQVFNIKNVCYYGGQDISLELIMNNSFPDIRVVSFMENEKFPLSNVDGFYTDSGLAVDMYIKGKRIVAFSTLDDSVGYDGINGKIDLLIAGQNIEQLNYKLNPTKIVSYRTAVGFDDGESKGNFIYSFK
ncbi:MAG: ComEC/Rec2 family competence protein [Clostridia bacterium]|nr:ComEC/Rec2 family competence protein [Clostridia bacterium]